MEWSTVHEIDNAGFHIWRGRTHDEEILCITEALIPAEGSAIQGAEYAYEDIDVEPMRTYWYKLEDVSFDGTSTFHGPVQAMAIEGACFVVTVGAKGNF